MKRQKKTSVSVWPGSMQQTPHPLPEPGGNIYLVTNKGSSAVYIGRPGTVDGRVLLPGESWAFHPGAVAQTLELGAVANVQVEEIHE